MSTQVPRVHGQTPFNEEHSPEYEAERDYNMNMDPSNDCCSFVLSSYLSVTVGVVLSGVGWSCQEGGFGRSAQCSGDGSSSVRSGWTGSLFSDMFPALKLSAGCWARKKGTRHIWSRGFLMSRKQVGSPRKLRHAEMPQLLTLPC